LGDTNRHQRTITHSVLEVIKARDANLGKELVVRRLGSGMFVQT